MYTSYFTKELSLNFIEEHFARKLCQCQGGSFAAEDILS